MDTQFISELAARIPYGIVCEMGPKNGNKIVEKLHWGGLEQLVRGNWEIKPYLFPLSSMTEEQREEIEDKLTFPNKSDGGWIEILYNNKYEIPFWFVDFCNKNHLDYRGLIEKSLALDTTGLNIY